MTTQPKKLSLSGVPLEAIGEMRPVDFTADSGYGLNRAAFLARREAPPTELIPDGQEFQSDPGPHPALREFLIASLISKLQNGDALAKTNEDRSLLVEAHMAFLEYLGDYAGDYASQGGLPKSAPVESTSVLWQARLGAVTNELPTWLSEVLTARHAIAVEEDPTDLPLLPVDSDDPVAYADAAAKEYAAIYADPTEMNRIKGKGRISGSATLATMIDNSIPKVVPLPTKEPIVIVVRPIEPNPDEMGPLALGREDRGNGKDSLSLQAMQLLAAARKADPAAGEVQPSFVISRQTVDQALSTMDVMRDYEWEQIGGLAHSVSFTGGRLVDEYGNPIINEGGVGIAV